MPSGEKKIFIQKQIKLIYGDENQNIDLLIIFEAKGGLEMVREQEGMWITSNILFLDLDVGYKSVHFVIFH